METIINFSFTNYKVVQRYAAHVYLRSRILFHRLLMFKYPITGFLGYCNLHLRKLQDLKNKSDPNKWYVYEYKGMVRVQLKEIVNIFNNII